MRTLKSSLGLPALLLALAGGLFTGCESTGGGSVTGSAYYGVGIYDPWYYGGYHDGGDIIITPPPRPERPVARPLPAPLPTPRPMPSIPSAPRPMPRPAMRR